MKKLLSLMGRGVLGSADSLGGAALMVRSSFFWLFRSKLEVKQTVIQSVKIGVESVGVILLTNFFTGMAIIIAIAGAIMGFTVSKFADLTIAQVDNDTLITIWKQYHVLVQFFFILLGTILAVKKVPDLDELDKDLSKISKRRSGLYKILDSSVVIDGRILDICDSHFLSGTLIAPRFMRQFIGQ